MFFDPILRGLEETSAFETHRILDENSLSGLTKWRLIQAPNEAMRAVHEALIGAVRFLMNMDQRLCATRAYSTGGGRGDSPVKNAIRHRMSRYFYLLDIASAFPSIDGARLGEAVFQAIDGRDAYRERFLEVFNTHFLDENGGLVVGGPASPILFNFYCRLFIDPTIAELSARHGFLYTRYIDDLSVSHVSEQIGPGLRRAIRSVVESAGFQVNHRKSQVLDITKGNVVVTGVGIENGGRLFVPREFVRSLNGLLTWLLHTAEVGVEYDEARKRAGGMMGTFRHITRSSGHEMNAQELALERKWKSFQKRPRLMF